MLPEVGSVLNGGHNTTFNNCSHGVKLIQECTFSEIEEYLDGETFIRWKITMRIRTVWRLDGSATTIGHTVVRWDI